MISTGVKDLKNNLSYYLREVKKGEKITVTDHEKAIATITRLERSEEDAHLISLAKEGFAVWNGGKPVGSKSPVKIKGKTVARIVIEDRG